MTTPHLPPEILEQIFQYTPTGYRGQLDLWSFCLVSRSWYASSIRRLYHTPSIIGKNFDAFSATLCPSVNANIRRTELALFVIELNMVNLVYNGSKSLTARLLGRVKAQLELLVAPATTFSLLAFSALAKCERLRVLNLEYVIESLDVVLLLRTVGKLKCLDALSFRMAICKSKGHRKSEENLDFPTTLRKLRITDLCDDNAYFLLNDALRRSGIDHLDVMLGGELVWTEWWIFIEQLKIKRLYLHSSTRGRDRTGHESGPYSLEYLLYHCHDLDELSIPLEYFNAGYFRTANTIEKPSTLRALNIHPSVSEFTGPLLLEHEWRQLWENVNHGHLKSLKKIYVWDRKDAIKFEEVESIIPGYLEQIDQALFDEAVEDSGLFLTGNKDFS